MKVSHLSLGNFRCFEDLSLELSEGLVVVIGPNASGKTSLLEAIFVASAGRSPRTRAETELVRWGEVQALVEVAFLRDDGRREQVRVMWDLTGRGPRKTLLLGDKAVRRAADLLSRLPLVMFAPADLRLAQAEPASRRRFMNLALARLRPAYADDLARYRRALQQRNRLLQAQAPESQVRAWTEQLVRSGGQVAAQRAWLVAELGRQAAQIHGELSSHRESLSCTYAGDLAPAESAEEAIQAFRQLLAERVADDRRLGRTSVGPHRDDLRVSLGGRAVRRFGSQGQQRTAALALKLAEAELVCAVTGETPVLLLDDCLSELDEARAAQVLRLTTNYRQLIVTVASQEPALLAARVSQWVYLAQGRVERVEILSDETEG